MNPQSSASTDPSPSLATDPLNEVLEELRREWRSVEGIEDVRFLFRSGAGAFVDENGALCVPPGSSAHPVTQAAALGRTISGVWDPEGREGLACPLRRAGDPDVVVWFTVRNTMPGTEPGGFVFENAARRLERELDRASLAWTSQRREAALAFANDASAAFLRETSLHRALRLCATDLAELSGAKEVSFWRVAAAAEPMCIAQARPGSTDGERANTVERLVLELARVPQRVMVTGTAGSPHFAWCHTEGIERFLAYPLTAYDRFFGVLVLLDYATHAALSGERPAPGVDDAAAVCASAAAKALYQVDLQDQVTRLRAEVRSAERLAEQGRRDAAHLDLARQAAQALEEALRELRAAGPTEGSSGAASTSRALEILEELSLLTAFPPSRLRLTDLNDVVCAAVEAVRQAEGPPSSVSLRLQGDLPKLLLDGDRIRRVLATLLEHGLSGTDERQATVTSRAAGSEVVVEIRVPRRRVVAGILDTLFLPFLPHDPSAPKGSLPLADQIVNEHGGQLRARSDGKEGLFFALSLPVSGNEERRARKRDRRFGSDRRKPADPA